MIKNGIYALSALATDGAGVDAGGVLILHDGKIHGGDSYVYYVGSYKCSGGMWEGEMLSKEHTPTNRPVAERVQQITFRGSYTDTEAEVEATVIVAKQRIRYDATLRFLTAGGR
jgi:T3SS negative regulator,GrlR